MSIDRNKPSFVLFPVNNNRTAWRPVGLPMIMVVPKKRDFVGFPIPNSGVFDVKILIENTPREALVAGHDHVGLRFPDSELYAKYLSSLDLSESLIDLNAVSIYRNGELIQANNAADGDIIDYTTGTGVRSQLEFITGADYYDLSLFLIEIETLPNGLYNLIYQADYYERVVSSDEVPEFLCINPNSVQNTIHRFPIQHPGAVMQEFYRLTPPPYLTNASKAFDSTVALYRPFTDVLQDVHDEQGLLERINWVLDAPPQIIPYLSSLLGWDLPYFPKSLDQLRRAVLRRTVEFQNLKGSKRALTDVFKLFGFEILITSLWWSSDGKRLIRPGETLPDQYSGQEINIDQKDQVDLCIKDLKLATDIVFNIPLLYRPQVISSIDAFKSLQDGGDVTLDAYVVKYDTSSGSAYSILKDLSELIETEPADYGQTANVIVDSQGFLNPTSIHDMIGGSNVDSYSQILISGSLGQAKDEVSVGVNPPLILTGVSLNRESNNLSVTLNGYYDSRDDYRLFLFATYKRVDVTVPSSLAYMQSNKFDVQVITSNDKEYADSTTLEFAIEFLFRLKAFHSLLNSVKTRIELNETYQVTDLCVGGGYTQRYDTAIGRLQVPPAIIPSLPVDIDDCSKLDPTSLGYKDSDLLYRKRVLESLPDDFSAWKALDDREPIESILSRIMTPSPAPGRDSCKYTYRGQDRILDTRRELRDIEFTPSPNANSSSDGKLSPITNVVSGVFDPTGPMISGSATSYGSFNREYTDYRDVFCSLDNVNDYCYKGRVDDEVLHQSILDNTEIFRSKPCNLSMGSGSYYTYPTYATVAIYGTSNPDLDGKTQKTVYSGKSLEYNIKHFSSGPQGQYLNASYDIPNLPLDSSKLGRLYRSYDTPFGQTIHYTNRDGDFLNQQNFLALQRPGLDIAKATMHLPGCNFPRMYALENDYSTSSIKAKPWDPRYSTSCGTPSPCGGTEPTYLNAHLELGSDGNEYLIYDNIDFSIEGNGLVADITSLGDHSLVTGHVFNDTDVIHSIYSKDASSNPAVVFEQLCDYDTSCQEGILSINDPLFNSHYQCATDLVDFADGYSCLSGFLNYDGQDLGRSGLYDQVLEDLGLDLTPPSTGTVYLFRLNSGILAQEQAYRLDCGCLVANCDSTDSTSEAELTTICSNSLFVDNDGEMDWDTSHVSLHPVLSLQESVGVSTIQCDGLISSMLETL